VRDVLRMGCGLSKGDLKAVQDGTNMSDAEVKEAYKGFKQENKSDKINLEKFTKLVASMNTNKGNATEYSKHLFRALDKNKDNRVSFKEIMLGFHHLSSQGSQEERLRIVFEMYDASCTKTLSHADVTTLTKALHDLQGKSLTSQELEEKVKGIFGQCDLNKDGKITEDEFLKAGVSIAEMFELEADE